MADAAEVYLAVLFLVTGPLLCFAGEHFFKMFLFTVGAVGGAIGMALFLGMAQFQLESSHVVVLLSVVAIMCGILTLKVVRLTIFSIGAISAGLSSGLVFNVLYQWTAWHPSSRGVVIGMTVLFSILGGVALLFAVNKVLVRFISAGIGSYLISTSIFFFVHSFGWAKNQPFSPISIYKATVVDQDIEELVCEGYVCISFIVVVCFFFIAGCLVQFRKFGSEPSGFEGKRIHPRFRRREPKGARGPYAEA